MLAVFVKIPIKEEKMTEAIEAFKELIQEVSKEDGTLSYTLNVSKKEPNTLFILERYKDKESFGVHNSTPHFKAFSTKAADFFAGKMEVVIMDELASK
jgi:quinol monooxygenase YgiN